MNSERNIVTKLFESKKQELEEASFEANGSIYKCAFGRYTKDGEPITRDEYFQAQGGDSKKSSALPTASTSFRDIMKSLPPDEYDMVEDFRDNFEQSSKLLDKSKEDIRMTAEEDMSYDEFSKLIDDITEGDWTKGESVPYGGNYFSYQTYTHNDTGESVVVCTSRDGYQMIYH